MGIKAASATLLFLVCAGCGTSRAPAADAPVGPDHTLGQTDLYPEKSVFRYSPNLSVTYHDTYKVVSVQPSRQARYRFDYVLFQRGTPRPRGYANARFVAIPVRTYAMDVNGGMQRNLQALGIDEGLVAVSSFRGVYPGEMARIWRRMRDGMLKEIGGGADVNKELVRELQPDLVFSDFVGLSSSFLAVEKMGLSGVPLGNRTEKSPLASAEWIKLVALFFNREREANRLFDGIAARYEALRNRAAAAATRPKVLPTPGGAFFLDRAVDRALVWDAGGDPVPSEPVWHYAYDPPYERVLDEGHDAFVWPFADPVWKSTADAVHFDSRLERFRAVREGRVYAPGRNVPKGVINPYYSAAYNFPDVVLADLMSLIHPDLIPDHELVFFHRLNN